jgi:hypothetical protein
MMLVTAIVAPHALRDARAGSDLLDVASTTVAAVVRGRTGGRGADAL